MKLPLLLPCLILLLILYMVIRLTALQGTYFSSSLQQNTNLLKENNYDKLNYSNQDSSKVMEGEVQITIKQPYNTINAIVYGYNSIPNQTDDTPCITASGFNLCLRETSIQPMGVDNGSNKQGYVANNCLAFDTAIVISNIEYIVVDRMNPRYSCNVFDIWFPTYEEAINWGRREVEVKIYN